MGGGEGEEDLSGVGRGGGGGGRSRVPSPCFLRSSEAVPARKAVSRCFPRRRRRRRRRRHLRPPSSAEHVLPRQHGTRCAVGARLFI